MSGPGNATTCARDGVVEFLGGFDPFGCDPDHSFRTPAPLRRGFTHPCFQKALGLEPVNGGVQRANGAILSAGRNFFANRGAVRVFAEAKSGGDKKIFELADHD